ncbi:AfsR/SARP family transcriptional regulator [Streptomyces sp. YKOK-I1]
MSGRSVVPGDPESRRILALLALRADQVVPTCLMARELWADGSPPGGDSRIVAHIASLRRRLTEAIQASDAFGGGRATGADLLVSTPTGYRLDSSGGVLDAREFERHIGAGYRAMAAGDAARAAERLGLALSLWGEDDALGDPDLGPVLRGHARRLHEARMTAVEQWAAIELQLGHHRERLDALAELAERHTTHQGLHRHYMTALARCGRTADALRVYERLGSTLRREGGAGLSPDVRRLRDRIVLHAPGPDGRPGAPMALPPSFAG